MKPMPDELVLTKQRVQEIIQSYLNDVVYGELIEVYDIYPLGLHDSEYLIRTRRKKNANSGTI